MASSLNIKYTTLQATYASERKNCITTVTLQGTRTSEMTKLG